MKIYSLKRNGFAFSLSKSVRQTVFDIILSESVFNSRFVTFILLDCYPSHTFSLNCLQI